MAGPDNVDGLLDLLVDTPVWVADPLQMVRAALEYLGIRVGTLLH